MMHHVPLVQTNTKTSEATSKIDPQCPLIQHGPVCSHPTPIPTPGSQSNHSTAFDENDNLFTSQNNVVIRHRRDVAAQTRLLHTSFSTPYIQDSFFGKLSVKSFAPTSMWERISIQ
ncbi:hypothetical protein PVAP13_3KG163954 [Panicum virgatum]|uniref:Uncharacterized protein n=1 Tax=Panicum virgatum TaxID=38727 RepID=A0A8T0USH4_PANVG|nr:hypothetical protein PVAP13_3KG163954 [Panicum virgatum]